MKAESSALRQARERAERAEKEVERLKGLLQAASHALRSYQYGNASIGLAQSMADRIDQQLQSTEGGRG